MARPKKIRTLNHQQLIALARNIYLPKPGFIGLQNGYGPAVKTLAD